LRQRRARCTKAHSHFRRAHFGQCARVLGAETVRDLHGRSRTQSEHSGNMVGVVSLDTRPEDALLLQEFFGSDKEAVHPVHLPATTRTHSARRRTSRTRKPASITAVSTSSNRESIMPDKTSRAPAPRCAVRVGSAAIITSATMFITITS